LSGRRLTRQENGGQKNKAGGEFLKLFASDRFPKTDHRLPTTDHQEFMRAHTHCLFSLTLTAFALETADWKPLALAALASQLPDVDTSTSLAGRCFRPLARWLENRWPHRTVTHSFLATAILALLAWPLRWQHLSLWYALTLGYFSGWFGDAFTKSGGAAFYPLSTARLVIPANPRLRLATGSRAESVVCAVLLVGFLCSRHLNTNGGLLRRFNVWLAQPEGVVTLFARESNRHQILARIEGRSSPRPKRLLPSLKSSRSKANGCWCVLPMACCTGQDKAQPDFLQPATAPQ
jgi:membrane-bound metal-dependent hydrolase YbcI (DUF457 family)